MFDSAVDHVGDYADECVNPSDYSVDHIIIDFAVSSVIDCTFDYTVDNDTIDYTVNQVNC